MTSEGRVNVSDLEGKAGKEVLMERRNDDSCVTRTPPSSDDAVASSLRQPLSPLSWDDARASIRSVLERYMAQKSLPAHPPALTKAPTSKQNATSPRRRDRFGSWWLSNDMDLNLASLLSAGLLVFSIFSYSSRKSNNESYPALNAAAELRIYKSEIAGSALLLSACVFSILVVRWRKGTCSRDGDAGRRRIVKAFLGGLDSFEAFGQGSKAGKADDTNAESKSLEQLNSIGKNDTADGMSLSGTPHTDFYPAYRRSSSARLDGEDEKAVKEEGKWHRVPTLLLVKGDCVALQVGDMAPADCRLMTSTSHGEQDKVPSLPPVIIRGGERVTLQILNPPSSTPSSSNSTGGAGRTSNSFLDYDKSKGLASLPPGQSSLPSGSVELLTLCNDMRLFEVVETPLESFLKSQSAQNRPPLIHRQAQAVRLALHLLSVIVCALTALFLFVRPNITSTDLSLILNLPFLSALGVLPVVMPTCLFCLEVLGVSRILVAVHPYSPYGQRTTFDEEVSSPSSSQSERVLFLRYCVTTIASRLSVAHSPPWVLTRPFRMLANRLTKWQSDRHTYRELLQIPPATAYLLEKLGMTTSLALIDDELACEPHSTPQQLLIPSGSGLKLLDLCPTYDDEIETNSVDDDRTAVTKGGGRKRGKSFESDDSDSDDFDNETQYQHTSGRKRTIAALRRRYKRKVSGASGQKRGSSSGSNFEDRMGNVITGAGDMEVQFEDPLWWQHLPSLKCIGLACLLVDREETGREDTTARSSLIPTLPPSAAADGGTPNLDPTNAVAKKALVRHICQERPRSQLLSLAQCIGFSTSQNSFGPRGDLSPFTERRRLHTIATRLLSDRLSADAHALGLEESRSWGLLRPDATAVVVQDSRSGAYQLLTVGDARVVTDLCQDSWQGENSTISPLGAIDRGAILDTSNNWSLADMHVTAFSYAPVPHTLEQRFCGGVAAGGGTIGLSPDMGRTVYLIDNSPRKEAPTFAQKDEDWSLVKNQIFLGVLGSSVSPRKEIEKIIDLCTAAGVRFVYFSPRNMRRTKELASQMGIDVAWNCAISLRALDDGQEDPHRMTSTYADWDVNARLPHGVEDVKRHLEEVDNVPLLVSLYTDVTKQTTAEMVKIFQDYSDTVLSVGVSHLPRNDGIFSSADLSIGVDVLSSCCPHDFGNHDMLLPHEVSFVSSIAAHSCLFNLKGSGTMSYIPDIIARGRAALEAVSAGAHYVFTGCITFSFYILLCPCTAATVVPFVPTLGSVLYLLVILPFLCLAMAMTPSDEESMSRVPPKNDQSVAFSRGEGKRLYSHALLRALPPAALPQILYLIVIGELILKFEPDLVRSECFVNPERSNWVSVIRCDALRHYSGIARTSAGALTMAEMMLCIVVSSAGFVYRTNPLQNEKPWTKNHTWVWCVGLCIAIITVFLVATLEQGTMSALPWYFFFLAVIIPFLCLAVGELIKRTDRRHENRAVMLRRLQFETRLGMWSPKEGETLDKRTNPL